MRQCSDWELYAEYREDDTKIKTLGVFPLSERPSKDPTLKLCELNGQDDEGFNTKMQKYYNLSAIDFDDITNAPDLRLTYTITNL